MKNDILIAYYSWHGNTRRIAKLIERETGGTLFEIEPARPYTTDYQAVVQQAKKEIQAGFRPELKAMPESTSYEVLFLGTPIWWHTLVPPLAAFIDRCDLNRKTVVPFLTHGGGGSGSFEKDITRMNGTAVSNPFKLTMLCFSNFCSVSIAWVVHERIVLSSPLEETGF